MSSLNSFVIRTSLPVLFGYLALGSAFGVLFSELHYHWLYATLMGVLIYAGAGQFLAVGLLANHASLLEMSVATFLLNSRHIFYGLSLISRLRTRGWAKLYQIFSLTDETYSLLSATTVAKGLNPAQFQLRLAFVNHLYWVLGCTLGAWLGQGFTFSTAGVEFVLPALFVVLAIEQYKAVQQPWVFILAGVIGLSVLFLINREQMLLIAIILSVLVLLGQYHRQRKQIGG